MNISSMVYKIDNFQDEIVKTGFLRDIQEYITSLSQPQNNQNIILLKDIINKVLDKLNNLINTSVPDDIDTMIVTESIKKFSIQEYNKKLTVIRDDPQMSTSQIYSNLNQYLNGMYSELNQILNELNRVKEVILPYHLKNNVNEKSASVSIVFRDHETIYNLKQFGKTITKWNRTLGLFGQLVSSEAQKDIELANIQNGSLDVVLNLDVEIAINFAEIMKYALMAFGGYLSYKKAAVPIIETYLGNKKLIESEKEREKLMLENIGLAVKSKLLEMHKDRLKVDTKINKESIDKKIDEISGLVTEHVIKGNDVKLLIDFKDVEDEDGKRKQQIIEDVKRESITVKSNFQQLTDDDARLLLEMYKTADE